MSVELSVELPVELAVELAVELVRIRQDLVSDSSFVRTGVESVTIWSGFVRILSGSVRICQDLCGDAPGVRYCRGVCLLLVSEEGRLLEVDNFPATQCGFLQEHRESATGSGYGCSLLRGRVSHPRSASRCIS